MFKKKGKNPVLAVILSLVFPGLGQAYAGKYDRGLLVAALALLLWMLAMFLFVLLGGFWPTISPEAPWFIRYITYDFMWFWSFFVVIYLWMLYDAYRSTKN